VTGANEREKCRMPEYVPAVASMSWPSLSPITTVRARPFVTVLARFRSELELEKIFGSKSDINGVKLGLVLTWIVQAPLLNAVK
jgi:hypothetical protein